MRRVLLGSVVACCLFAYALPTYAAGSYFVLADDPLADDANSCQASADPCATLTGVLAKISDNVDPSNATVYAQGTFVENVSINDREMDGLTLTAYDEEDRPVINAGGEGIGLSISANGLSDITIEHFDITNAASNGVAVYGNSDTHIDEVKLVDLYIHDFDSTVDSTQYGIYLSNADHVTINNVTIDTIGSATFNTVSTYGIYAHGTDNLTIKNSTIRNLTASFESEVESSFYGTIYGIYVNEADDVHIQKNALYNLLSEVSLASTATSYSNVHGISMRDNVDVVVRDNSIRNVTINITEEGDGSNGYTNMYGIYGFSQNRAVVRGNTLKDFTNTFTTGGTSYGHPTVYGISLEGIEQNIVRGNVVNRLTAFADNAYADAKVYGIGVVDMIQATIRNNTVKNTLAEGRGNGGSNTAIQVQDAPQVNIFRNRLADFLAAGPETSSSVGIKLGYNTSADVFNNAIYVTDTTDQEHVHGIVLLSAQSSPMRIFHNTLVGMLTCLNIDALGETYFMNNVCYMTDGGAYGVEVTSGTSDLTQLHSDYNSFYNALGVLSFNDTTEGILALSDWQTGDYAQDAHSLTIDPQISLARPTGKKYLHLKTGSPLIGAGATSLHFDTDHAMTKRLYVDWDGQKRFSNAHPDIGFDQYQ